MTATKKINPVGPKADLAWDAFAMIAEENAKQLKTHLADANHGVGIMSSGELVGITYGSHLLKINHLIQVVGPGNPIIGSPISELKIEQDMELVDLCRYHNAVATTEGGDNFIEVMIEGEA